MEIYKKLLSKIQREGVESSDRTGTGTVSVFGTSMRFDLSKGFPLVTGRRIHLRSIIHELLWFLKGDTNIKYLNDNGVSIWDEWADENGDLGPVYGRQWVEWNDTRIIDKQVYEQFYKDDSSFKMHLLEGVSDKVVIERTINQIEDLINNLKTSPKSRRHVVTAWNPSVLPDEKLDPKENVKSGKAALPSCHTLFQFHAEELSLDERLEKYPHLISHDEDPIEIEKVLDIFLAPKYKLSCSMYQRSADTVLGVPFNIASYSLLTMMVAQCVNMDVGEFVWVGGDTHIYNNHLKPLKEYMNNPVHELPRIVLNPKVDNIFDFTFEDIVLKRYNSNEPISFKISV